MQRISRIYQKLKIQIYHPLHSFGTKCMYRYWDLDLGVKVSIVWMMVCLVSLFLPWIQSLDTVTPLSSWRLTENAFSIFAGYIWYIMLLYIIWVLFMLLSERKKQKLKHISFFNIPDNILILYTFFLFSILCLQYFFIIWWFQHINQNIIYWKWLILCTSGSFLIFFWSLLVNKTKQKSSTASYAYDGNEDPYIPQEKKSKNMELPF